MGKKSPVFIYRPDQFDLDAALHITLFVGDFPEISRFLVALPVLGTQPAKRSSSDNTPTAMNLPTDSQLPAVDTSLRYVRVLERRADGLVSFEFSIGWPELAVELMLPAPAFEAFCANNRVQRLDT